MIHLIGFICFFSNANCIAPVLIGHGFDTMIACTKFKDKLDAAVQPVEFIDAKLLCMEDEDVL
jgi:hypothetical protein